ETKDGRLGRRVRRKQGGPQIATRCLHGVPPAEAGGARGSPKRSHYRPRASAASTPGPKGTDHFHRRESHRDAEGDGSGCAGSHDSAWDWSFQGVRVRIALSVASGDGAPAAVEARFRVARMLQIKDRLSFFYVERGSLTVIDGCLVLTDNEDRTQYEVPARATVTIMVGPGTTVSTEAVRLAAAYGVLITWVGEHGVRCYSAGRPWSDNVEWLEKQVRCYSDPQLTLRVAREMFFRRFGVRMERRSIDELRGLEGARVRELYKLKAQEAGIRWSGRNYIPGNPFG